MASGDYTEREWSEVCEHHRDWRERPADFHERDVDAADAARKERKENATLDDLQQRADEIAAADRAEDANLRRYPATCPTCRGTGGGQYNDCSTCGGNGVV